MPHRRLRSWRQRQQLQKATLAREKASKARKKCLVKLEETPASSLMGKVKKKIKKVKKRIRRFIDSFYMPQGA